MFAFGFAIYIERVIWLSLSFIFINNSNSRIGELYFFLKVYLRYGDWCTRTFSRFLLYDCLLYNWMEVQISPLKNAFLIVGVTIFHLIQNVRNLLFTPHHPAFNTFYVCEYFERRNDQLSTVFSLVGPPSPLSSFPR